MFKIVIYDDDNDVIISKSVKGNNLNKVHIKTDSEDFECDINTQTKSKLSNKNLNDMFADDSFWND